MPARNGAVNPTAPPNMDAGQGENRPALQRRPAKRRELGGSRGDRGRRRLCSASETLFRPKIKRHSQMAGICLYTIGQWARPV
jgi:hypothetical protein